MTKLSDKLANLGEYFGIVSKSYYHRRPTISYDSDNKRLYYLDFSNRADYSGPADKKSLPVYKMGDHAKYLPVQICLYALGNWQLHCNNPDDIRRDTFLKCADWLRTNQSAEGIWMSPFDKPKFDLKAPFPSAMAQGLGISCLVRAHDLTRNDDYLNAALAAVKPFRVDIKDGGIASYDNGLVFYEEYPSYPFRHVLNGFIYSLWGLYDLFRFSEHAQAKSLFDDGIATLTKWLPLYDTGHWSLYHIPSKPANPSTMHYHLLHIDQLEILHGITAEKLFNKYSQLWKSYLNNKINAIRTLPSKLWWDLTA